MKRLTGLDGITLHGETSVMPTHVTAVLFCDPEARGETTAGAIYQLLAERTAAMPGFRQRLLTRSSGWASRHGSRTPRSMSTAICIVSGWQNPAPCGS